LIVLLRNPKSRVAGSAEKAWLQDVVNMYAAEDCELHGCPVYLGEADLILGTKVAATFSARAAAREAIMQAAAAAAAAAAVPVEPTPAVPGDSAPGVVRTDTVAATAALDGTGSHNGTSDVSDVAPVAIAPEAPETSVAAVIPGRGRGRGGGQGRGRAAGKAAAKADAKAEGAPATKRQRQVKPKAKAKAKSRIELELLADRLVSSPEHGVVDMLDDEALAESDKDSSTSEAD
jgi:hypothetical protein